VFNFVVLWKWKSRSKGEIRGVYILFGGTKDDSRMVL
jgi:hypothetical protein